MYMYATCQLENITGVLCECRITTSKLFKQKTCKYWYISIPVFHIMFAWLGLYFANILVLNFSQTSQIGKDIITYIYIFIY